MNHPSHCTHTCSFWDDSCCTGHDSISATDDRFCSSQSANTANDNNAGIQLLHSLREYEHGLMPNSLSLLDTTDITNHGQLNTDPSLHIPNVITDSTESISTYTFSPSPHQSAANHPYTLQLCLLEGVWCKIQLVSNGFKVSPLINSCNSTRFAYI
ncbi:hypothetical protein O5D80_004731 [Batrachochytrium dendrobatidis]|nr:hypothetical protein O5D80_004731 [Batrachochytrium dendrobatidis]